MANINVNSSSDNLSTIQELILDEQKLVTYITLSKDLCIHVNEAKRLLSQAVEEIKGKNTNNHLNVSYIISGLSDNNTGRTIVCTDSDLEVQRKSFKSVFFQHIYSACQGSSGLDNSAFASLNKFEDFSLCAGLIRGSACTKRSTDEIGTLKSRGQKTVDERKQNIPSEKGIKENTNSVKTNGHIGNNVKKVHETKSEPVIKSEASSPKKDTQITTNSKSNVKNGVKPAKGITGFFSKSNSAPSTNSKAKETEKSKDNKIQPKLKNESSSESMTETQPMIKKEPLTEVENENSMDVDQEVPVKIKKEPESTKKKNSKKNSSLTQIKKNAKVDKKRKRVLHISDSESDDNDPFADDKPVDCESDDEIPPTPSTNTIKITSSILNPKKKRKIVDKTYTDEEGYILTRKEEVYESCSEDDVEMKVVKTESSSSIQVKAEKENVEQANKGKIEVSPKDKKAKSSKKKVSPPQKGKQASIMNFFKKV